MRIWAPFASDVEILGPSGTHAMTRTLRGWWQTDLTLSEGDDYWFYIDGERIPDPRSPWQPEGVHGPSRHVDHGTFRWTDEGWQARPLGSAILYELHVGTFTPGGTFDAAILRLDHLARLGVTHVEVMPVAEFEGNWGWGYDGVFPFAPHHAYGGPAGLKRLVDACHAKGLAVIMDVVYNHLGPCGNYLPRCGPFLSQLHKTPWGQSLNFDGPDCDGVREYFCDNARMWLRDYHLDGLRLDAVHAIIDSSATPFLEQLATEVDELKAQLGRHLVLIAESDLNDPRIVRPWEVGGFGIDAQWSDDIHHALHTVLTGEREGYYADFGGLADLACAMSRPYVYAGQHSEFRRRRHGRPSVNLSAHRFVSYLQNHDQLGNRARGERIGQLVNADLAKIGAALVLLGPYIPQLFQGEEWGSTSPFQYFVDFRREPELAAAVHSGRCQEFAAFGWQPDDVPDPTQEAAFRRSKLNWDDLELPQHRETLTWYRQLIQLRRDVSAFTTGRLDYVHCSYEEQNMWLRIDRGPVTIACNFSQKTAQVPLEGERQGRVLVASKPHWSFQSEVMVLPAESVLVFYERGQMETFAHWPNNALQLVTPVRRDRNTDGGAYRPQLH